MEIDLHGLFAEEAEFKLEKELDQCVRTKQNKLLIIHGKGEGILREMALITLNRYKKYILTIKKGEEINDSAGAGIIKVYFKFQEFRKTPYISKQRTISSATTKITPIRNKEEIINKKLAGKVKYLKRMNRGN